jgi:hypothetical protein
MKTLILAMFTTALVGCGSNHTFKASGETTHRVVVEVDFVVDICNEACDGEPNKAVCTSKCVTDIIGSIGDLINLVGVPQ